MIRVILAKLALPVLFIILLVSAFGNSKTNSSSSFPQSAIKILGENTQTSTTPVFTPTSSPTPVFSITVDELVSLTNFEREKQNITSLKINKKLDEAALQRAKIIVQSQDWSHEAGKTGVTYIKAIKDVDYWNTVKGENLARNWHTSKEVVDAWMSSVTGHRENILNKSFQDIGVATYEGVMDGHNTVVVVELFGGYIPPNYTLDGINSWKNSQQNLINIQPSWEKLKYFQGYYQKFQPDVNRINEVLLLRISKLGEIVTLMESNRWVPQNYFDEDKALSSEQTKLADKLNEGLRTF